MKKNTPLSKVPEAEWLRKSMIYVNAFVRTTELDDMPEPVLEYTFHPTRKWAFDLAWPKQKIAFELHGGTWSRGRHVRPRGFMLDRQKMNSATLLGWRVFEFTAEMVTSGEARRTLIYVMLGEAELERRLRAEGYGIPL